MRGIKETCDFVWTRTRGPAKLKTGQPNKRRTNGVDKHKAKPIKENQNKTRQITNCYLLHLSPFFSLLHRQI